MKNVKNAVRYCLTSKASYKACRFSLPNSPVGAVSHPFVLDAQGFRDPQRARNLSERAFCHRPRRRPRKARIVSRQLDMPDARTAALSVPAPAANRRRCSCRSLRRSWRSKNNGCSDPCRGARWHAVDKGDEGQ
jgi:hypothetical protein